MAALEMIVYLYNGQTEWIPSNTNIWIYARNSDSCGLFKTNNLFGKIKINIYVRGPAYTDGLNRAKSWSAEKKPYTVHAITKRH